MTRKSSNRNTNRRYVASPLFKLTKKEHDAINSIIRNTFTRMKTAPFTKVQWYDVLIRLVVGKMMIANFYTEETANEYAVCIKTMDTIEERAELTDYQTWTMTDEEAEVIEAGLDAVEVTQLEVPRVDFLKAHREVYKVITEMYQHKQKLLGKAPV